MRRITPTCCSTDVSLRSPVAQTGDARIVGVVDRGTDDVVVHIEVTDGEILIEENGTETETGLVTREEDHPADGAEAETGTGEFNSFAWSLSLAKVISLSVSVG